MTYIMPVGSPLCFEMAYSESRKVINDYLCSDWSMLFNNGLDFIDDILK